MYPFPKHAVIPIVQVCKTSTTLRKKMRLTHFAPLRFPFGLPCSPSSCQTRTFSEKKTRRRHQRIQFNAPALQFEHSVHESRHLPQFEASQQTVSKCVKLCRYVRLQVLTELHVCINYIQLHHIISYYIILHPPRPDPPQDCPRSLCVESSRKQFALLLVQPVKGKVL